MVRKTPLVSSNLYVKNDYFTKTGSGQMETLKKREPFFEQAALNQGIARQVRDSDDDVIIAATTANLSFLCFLLCLELFAGFLCCI